MNCLSFADISSGEEAELRKKAKQPLKVQVTRVATPGSQAPQPQRDTRKSSQPSSSTSPEVMPAYVPTDPKDELELSEDDEPGFIESQKKGALYALKEYEKVRAEKEGRKADVSTYKLLLVNYLHSRCYRLLQAFTNELLFQFVNYLDTRCYRLLQAFTNELLFQFVTTYHKATTYGQRLDPQVYPFIAAGYLPPQPDDHAARVHGNVYKDDSAASTMLYMSMVENANYCAIRRNEHLLRVHTATLGNLVTVCLQNRMLLKSIKSDLNLIKGMGLNVEEPSDFEPPVFYEDAVSTSSYKPLLVK